MTVTAAVTERDEIFRTTSECAYGREPEPAVLLRNNHAEELIALDEVPDFRRKIAPFPTDFPLVNHGAELLDRAVQESGLFLGQGRRREGQQFRPIRIAREQVRIPPDVACL